MEQKVAMEQSEITSAVPPGSRSMSYDSLLAVIAQQRREYQQMYQQSQQDEARELICRDASEYLHDVLANRLFPYWYGTDWDFNGISETPGRGQIACGYFISTTLKQAGFKVNRYRLAQQHATGIIETLCGAHLTFYHKDSVLAYLDHHPDGLFVLGLDFHVVFVDKQGNDLAVVHSSYLYPVAVVREGWNESRVLDASGVFVIGNLTASRELIKKWIQGVEIR